MRRCLNLLILFVCLLPAAASGSGRMMDLADEYFRQGLYPEAVSAYQDEFRNAHDLDSRAVALLRIGDLYNLFLDNRGLALEHYELLIKNYPQSRHAANAWFSSGMILYENARFPEAAERFRTYLEKYPRDSRRGTAEFMVYACINPPASAAKKPRTAPVPESSAREEIRVLLSPAAKRVAISACAPVEIKGPKGNVILSTDGRTVAIQRSGRSLRVNGRDAGSGELTASSGSGILNVNGKNYRGYVKVACNSNGSLSAINVVDIEEYLYGVVPKEMSSAWPAEALKAQAVVARTYALYLKGKKGGNGFDVLDDTNSQVYGGCDAETENARCAVDDTRGQVLTRDGKLVLAYFHANSGGRTEDAKHVWTTDIPYLRGVEDRFSLDGPGCTWSTVMSLSDIRGLLNKQGIVTGSICDLVAHDRSPSGRVAQITVRHSRGETKLSGNTFRLKLDPSRIRSSLFTMTREGQKIRFEGRGYGHGVGLSQAGAYVMSRAGFSFPEILQHYYSGVTISKK